MKDKSDGSDLLRLARRIMQQQLLEHIPAEKKYTARMVAGAMAIVARQIDRGDENENDEESRQLSADIRAGRVGPQLPDYDTVYETLCDQARLKVLISNPGYLDQ